MAALARLPQPVASDRINRDGAAWPGGFTMVSVRDAKAIWDAIRALPPTKRPHQVRHAFDIVLSNLRRNTGEVMLSREEMADEIGCSPSRVSEIMGTLEELSAIRRERRRVQGIKGPGQVVYIVNPTVAWNGRLDVRKTAVRRSPQLSLVTVDV